MNNSISLLGARHTSPFPHPSIPATSLRTIRASFVLCWTLCQHRETSETGMGLVGGIFNLCHSWLHLYVPCLLAQLTAPNMVQC